MGSASPCRLVAGLCGVLIHDWSGGLVFPFTPAISLTAGLLFGGLGIAGAAAGQFAAVWITRDSPSDALILSLSFALTGVIGWAVFRYVPKLGRGLPNLRSFLWTLAAAFVGGPRRLRADAGLLRLRPARRRGPRRLLWIWTWGTGALVSATLLAPPILLLFDRYGRRWMVPIPGRAPGRGRSAGRRGFPAAARRRSSSSPLRWPAMRGTGRGISCWAPRWCWRRRPLGLGLVWLLPRGNEWTTLVYLLPILWAALRYGLRGGVLAASGSGLCHLRVSRGWWSSLRHDRIASSEVWTGRADLLILSVAGALVGWSRQREVRLREELIESNRLLRRDLVRVSDALIQAVEAKDAYTGGHLRRVSEYAVAVGEKLGLRGRDLETLHYASLLHDVGKLGVPESVLRKEGPLDAQETGQMRRASGDRGADAGAAGTAARRGPARSPPPGALRRRARRAASGLSAGNLGGADPARRAHHRRGGCLRRHDHDPPLSECAAPDGGRGRAPPGAGAQFDPLVVDAFLDCLAERPWRV